jgi:hypothetical protein
MNFKERFRKILKSLGLLAKVEAKEEPSAEEWKLIVAEYKKQYSSELYTDLAADVENVRKAEAHDKALELVRSTIGQDANTADGAAASTEAAPEKPADLVGQVTTLANENKTLKSEVEDLKGKVGKLSATTEDDKPKEVKLTLIIGAGRHTATHAFGIEHPLFDGTKRWNKILMKGKAIDDDPDAELEDSFRKEVKNYGHSLSVRMQDLNRLGLLDPKSLDPKSDLVTYTDLESAGLGNQYVVRRQDALIARILELPSVKDIFPLRYGVQDKELITNAFFGEFSQAYQEGEVFKGGVSLQPEMGYVDDAMMKTRFQSLKWIERQYIGYLNTSGSDPIKWNQIEWMLLNIAKRLITEQNERNVMGIFRKPTTSEAGHYLHAGTGVVYTLLRYYHELKVMPLVDSAYGSYDSTTMLAVVESFVEKVKEGLPTLMGKTIYLNKNHKKWYANGYRSKYGKDFDFNGIPLDKVQDEDMPIIWVPNMGQLNLMWITDPGNIQLLEYVPGEMLKTAFEQRLESVFAWSTWKEGTSAAYAGKRFATRALLIANNFADQVIFMNHPVTELADDVTTCDGTVNVWFKSVANTTPAKAITDITGAVAGKAYVIEAGHLTNPQRVAKADKFSTITANWTPTDVGDYLMVVYTKVGEDDKFLELERCVAGVRTINATYQPNMPA